MSLETIVIAAMRKAAREMVPVMVTEGVVKSVNKTDKTCDVTREGLPDLLAVRLNAITQPGDDVVTIYPAVDSKVLCALVENQTTEAYLLTATDIEQVTGEIKGMKVSWTKDEIKINNGTNGGLTVTPELKTQLSKLTKRVDKIIEVISSQITACSLQPNPSWPATAQGLFASLLKEDFKDIENPKVKH